MEDEESLPFVNMERRSITGNIHQLGNIVRKENGKKKHLPALIKELNREADDFIICNNSLVLVCHLSTVLI